MNGADISRALAALRAGEPVVMPTDTVYGVAALPSIPGSIEAIFRIKGRPGDKPLPVLGAGVRDLSRVVMLDARALVLAERFWPGGLTLVLPRTQSFVADLGGDGTHGVAVRVPAHEVALDLLRRSGPLAVSSANRSGGREAATAEEARSALGDSVGVVVDGGRSGGLHSTIVSLLGEPRVLREGAVPAEAVTQALES